MFDPQKLLEQFLGGAGQQGGKPGLSPDLLKGLAGGSVAGSLATILLSGGSPKKMAKTMLKVGGTAVVAGLAYKAWNQWQASRGGSATPAAGANPEGTAFLPAPKAERDAMSLALLTAMIAAAKADGHIDEAEQKRIGLKLEEANLEPEARSFLAEELKKPLDIEAVVRAATTPELAAEIYAASRLAIDPDDPAEQAYLAMLAARLKLAPELKAAIESEAAKALA
ncbi:MAG: tellurite resistance TerB family protein [Proteobacteria bacterium]|nr:tellurite resistance TerB family protein [Pseudomonadota bacterium]